MKYDPRSAPDTPIGFKITDSAGREIPVRSTVPEIYKRYLLPGSKAYSAVHINNVYLFQQFKCPRYAIWSTDYLNKTACEMNGIVEKYIIELQFLIQNDLIYKIEGLQWESLKETQYNLLTSPPTTTDRVRFQQNSNQTFDIHITRSFLEEMAESLPQLQPFLSQVAQGEQAQFFNTPQFASPKTLYLIVKLIAEIRKTGLQRHHDTLVIEIIKSALTDPYSNKPYRIRFHEVEYVYQVERKISANLDDSKLLHECIQEAYVHPSKFRFLFKQIFGLLPNLYFTEKRMAAAQKLLHDLPGLSIQNVGMRVGYDNPSHFCAVYKNYYGRTPSMERKK